MSVFTPVSEGQLADWLKGYSVGVANSVEPVAAGIENTNYFVTTGQGRYVLTLFERLSAGDLPLYLGLMAHLARHGIPCPAPVADLSDRYLSELNGKPAALVTQLPGTSVEAPGAAECAELGALLARMHLAGSSYRAYLENPRGPKWWGDGDELVPASATEAESGSPPISVQIINIIIALRMPEAPRRAACSVFQFIVLVIPFIFRFYVHLSGMLFPLFCLEELPP